MAIPFKSLRYRTGPSQTWGINFQRNVASTNERSFLTPIPAALSFQGMFRFSSAATLVGVQVPESGTRLEIKPYAISDVTTDVNATPRLSNDPSGDFGVDVKYGVTQGLTADLTYNTDFAQVEVDEQQVNLTRFSLFFPREARVLPGRAGDLRFRRRVPRRPDSLLLQGRTLRRRRAGSSSSVGASD